MTYKEIINRFRTITDNHLMLQDFGYGDLSDLKYVSQLGTEEERVSYPYLYLLPSSSNRQGPVMNYSFNMIIMDMARPEDGADTDAYDNYITIQSQCQQYIDDVLAQLYYFYKDQPEIALTGITYTPFKEKYQDVVAGMTATISIAVPTPLNECIAPFDNWVLDTVEPLRTGTKNFNGTDPAFVDLLFLEYDIVGSPQRYKIEVDVDFRVLYDITQDPAPYNIPKIFVIQDGGELPRYIDFIDFKGNDRSVQNIKTTIEITLEDIPGGFDNKLFFNWGLAPNQYLPGANPPAQPISQPDAIEAIAGSLKIYKLA
jgi:hypothetical protein